MNCWAFHEGDKLEDAIAQFADDHRHEDNSTSGVALRADTLRSWLYSRAVSRAGLRVCDGQHGRKLAEGGSR